MPGLSRFSKVVLALSFMGLAGCKHPALKAVEEWEQGFACNRDDFADLKNLIQKYLSHGQSLRFADGTEEVYKIAQRLNDRVAEKCPARVLRECAPGRETSRVYVSADEFHSASELEGPLQAFGINGSTEMEFAPFSHTRESWTTYLDSPEKFQKGLQCFSRAGR